MTHLTRREFITGTAAGAIAMAAPGGLFLAVPPALASGAKVGEAAPTFALTSSAGQGVSLGDQRGKLVVLEWTNHECPYVRKHYDTGNMQSLQKEATGQGIIWYTVISSAPGEQGFVSAAEADKLTSRRSAAPTSVLFDPTGKVGKSYGATNTPHMYVIDKNGVLMYAGAIDDRPTTRKADVPGANNYVRAAIEAVAAGQPVKVPVTRAYGCTVKYA